MTFVQTLPGKKREAQRINIDLLPRNESKFPVLLNISKLFYLLLL